MLTRAGRRPGARQEAETIRSAQLRALDKVVLQTSLMYELYAPELPPAIMARYEATIRHPALTETFAHWAGAHNCEDAAKTPRERRDDDIRLRMPRRRREDTLKKKRCFVTLPES